MPKDGPPPHPRRSTREGGCPGAVPGLQSQCLQPTCGSLEFGVGVQISLSAQINLRDWNQRKERAQGWGHWPPENTHGVPLATATEQQSGVSSPVQGDPAS